MLNDLFAGLPIRPLADLPGGPEVVVLCPTAHLAADLRRAHGAAQMQAGARAWQALLSATSAQWLDHLTSAALLRGEIAPTALPGRFLTRPQERVVWAQAVARDLGGSEAAFGSAADELAVQAAALFDRDGLALAAAEAESLRLNWRINVPEALRTEEYRAFLRWRDEVEKICAPEGWHTADAAMLWRIGCVERGLTGLPTRMGLAGFTAPDPLLARLVKALVGRGVELFGVDFAHPAARTNIQAGECMDAEAECQAAARWAGNILAQNPQARLRIAVADLPARRSQLTQALDAALHAEAVGVTWADVERDYVFSQGTPLAAEFLVAVGCQLLQIATHPQRVALSELSALLCSPGWSADETEADARARIEVLMRELLPPEVSLPRWQRTLVRCAAQLNGAELAADLIAHTTAWVAASLEFSERRAALGKQLPSVWGGQFAVLLESLGWPGQRVLWPAEQAACDALREVLAGLLQLDAMLGAVSAGEALRQVARQCRDLQFRAARTGPARVEVCPLGEAVAGPVDGLWVMGLNEGVWPSAPQPNPLLPAELQRRAGVPAARADSLSAQAEAMQAIWLRSAPGVVCSWAGNEGEKKLQPSPLLASLIEAGKIEVASEAAAATAAGHAVFSVALSATLNEGSAALEYLHDARAPEVTEHEHIRGGTALLQAQALCPAWGFYRYRLGAAVLPAPTFGLDAKIRGALLHLALEAFWRGQTQAEVLQLSAAECGARINQAVAGALAHYQAGAIEPLPKRLAQLEATRLQTLLARWIAVEAQRAPFHVVACEARHELNIEGLAVRVVVDRIDELADGRWVIIDYKSGRSATADSWAQLRMAEPQLPVYAALAFPDKAVAAVVLARVVMDGAGFSGVAEEAGLLPDVKPLEAQRRRYAEADFPDWPGVRARWAANLTELAREIRTGCAAVVFEDEDALAYCDVKPLLRMAERRAQFEQAGLDS